MALFVGADRMGPEPAFLFLSVPLTFVKRHARVFLLTSQSFILLSPWWQEASLLLSGDY